MPAARDTVTELRLRLRAAGFSPIPTNGKAAVLKSWQSKTDTNDGEIELWGNLFPDADNTGILTQRVPVFDIDIGHEEAAEAVEQLVRERFEDAGRILVRIGRPPKRAIPFRADVAFKKIAIGVVAPNGDTGQKLELLADGQQLVAFGVHPDTQQPYHWHGGELGEIKREDLPELDEATARRLLDDAAELLVRDFGYQRARARPRKGNGANEDTDDAGGAEDWAHLTDNIRSGRELHDSLRDLAAKLVASGMSGGAVVNFLRGLMDTSAAERDQRFQARYADIPRLVESAQAKQAPDSTRTRDGGGWKYHSNTPPVSPRWLIKAILPETGAALISGQWGTFKTTIALDLSVCIMTGLSFAGYRVNRRGAVLCLALEGGGALEARLAAVAKHHNINEPLPFAWRDNCPALTDKNAVDALCRLVAEAKADLDHFGLPLALIWVDTLITAAGYAASGDDNDAATAQKVMSVLRMVSHHTGALVAGIDHFGKVVETGTRGSSAKEGAADTVIALLGDRELSGNIKNTRLAIRKQRDGISGIEIPFTARMVEISIDEDGDPVTAPAIDWQATQTTQQGDARWTPSMQVLRRILMTTLADNGRDVRPFLDGPLVRACDLEVVRAEFYRQYPADGTEKQKTEARRKAFGRSLKETIARGLVMVREVDGVQLIWLAKPEPTNA